MLRAKEILYTSWEDIPLQKIKLILQLLPLIRWEVHHSASNTYLKNFLLKQLFRSRKLYLQTTPEQRVDLFTHEITWIKEFSTTFPIPTYRFEGITFYAPEPLLADITVEQLMEADIALFRYLKSERHSYLIHFLSQLYTHDQNPDRRGAADPAEVLKNIPDPEKIAIIRSYLGSFDQLRKRCSNLFPTNLHPKKGESVRPPDPAKSWQNLLFEMANTPGYPGMEAAKNALAWEALPYMDHEQEKIHRESERLKNPAAKF